MSTLCLYFLGSPRIEIDQQPVSVTRRKSLALVVYLAVSGEEQRRDTLATLLWPDSSQSRARGALRSELSRLNQLVGDTYLEIERETVALRWGEGIWLDFAAFDTALHESTVAAEVAPQAELEAQPTTGAETARIDRLAEAVALYRDDFLAGFALSDCPEFDEWQLFQAESLRQRFAAALETLIRLYENRGDYAAAIHYARRRLALDPLYEPGQRTLMRLYALSGQQAAALRQYEEFVRLLEEDDVGIPLSLEPDTVQLVDAIRERRLTSVSNGAPVEFQAQPDEQYSLPAQITTLVGRAQEIEQVADLLSRPDCSLLTITGGGGIGKTRLALAVAEQARATLGGDVCFVELAGINAPTYLASTLADALKAPVDQTGSMEQHLCNFLRDRRFLLVLDNFEHLLGGADLLSTLLQEAPELKLLVTSRERINLLGEWVFPLQELSYPAQTGADFKLEDKTEFAAIELFRQRARQVRPDFSLAEEPAEVATICRLVEGLPLAIELAATWVHMMSCAEIAAELAHSLDFLNTSLRNLPPRHRSLRAVFERSWQLLSDTEKSIFAQLSMFQGGFSRAAAEAVTGANVRLLSRLVDRSLVRWQPSGRFDMHELLRQFAAEKLAVTGEAHAGEQEQVRRRHCAFYSDYLARMDLYLTPSKTKRLLQQEKATIQRVAADIDNIRAAWQWAAQQRDAAAIRRMLRNLFQYYDFTGTAEEGIQVFEQAIAAFEDAFEASSVHSNHANIGLIGSLLLCKGGLMRLRHDQHTETYEVLNRSLTLLRQAAAHTPRGFSGNQAEVADNIRRSTKADNIRRSTKTEPENRVDIAFALTEMGQAVSALGQNRRGVELLAEGVARLRALDHWPGMGYALFDWGRVEVRWGRMGEAQRVLDEAVALLEHRSEYLHLRLLFMLVNVHNLQGRYRQGEAFLLRVVEGWSQLNPYRQFGLAFALRNLGDLLAATGDFVRAKQSFAEARALFERFGIGWNMDIALVWGPGVIARLEGDLAEAERLLTEALATARRINFEERIVVNLHNLAALRYDQKRYEEAKSLLDEALEIAQRTDFRSGMARVLCRLGHTAAALHRPGASRYYKEALEIAQKEQMDRVALDVLTGVAGQMTHRGKTEQAIALVALVLEHPAADVETRRMAKRLHTKLGLHPLSDAPPAPVQNRRPDLHTTAAALINTFL